MSYYGRTRTDRSTFKEVGVTTVQWNGGAIRALGSDGTWIGTVKTLADNVSPNFKTRMSQGEIMLNNMSYSEDTRTNELKEIVLNHVSIGNVVFRGDFGRQLERSATVSLSTRFNDASRVAESVALVKAYSAMNKSDIMGGEILKDLGSTLGMLRRPFSSAVDLLGRMTKNRARHAGKTTKSLAAATANTWLEYRYGWRPLIGDSRKVVQLASKSRTEAFGKGRRVVRGFDERETSYSPLTCQSWLYDGYLTVMLNGAASDSFVSQAKAGIIFALREPSSEAERWSRSLGMTSKDILPTAWEIMPFSFVMDWFVNVGDWLSAVTPNPFVEVLGSWVTSTAIGTRKTSGTWFWSPNSGPDLTGTLSPNTYVIKRIVRTVSPDIMAYPVPKGKLLSALQTADGLGLITQKIISGLQGFRH